MELDRGLDIIVATPGRLSDILEMKKIEFGRVSFLYWMRLIECLTWNLNLKFVRLLRRYLVVQKIVLANCTNHL